MTVPKVWTFFYGSFINTNVLKQVNLVPKQMEVAKLNGFDISIQPLANIFRSNQYCVYGIAATASHQELSRLYQYAENELGGIYLPEPVLVETLEGKWKPAFCYISPSLEPKAANNDYVDRIVKPAKELKFPEWYIKRLESFRPQE